MSVESLSLIFQSQLVQQYVPTPGFSPTSYVMINPNVSMTIYLLYAGEDRYTAGLWQLEKMRLA